MPYIQRRNYTNEKQIFNFATGNEVTSNVGVTSDYITPDSDGNKLISAGSFVASVNGVNRFLPRAKVTTAFSTGSATGVVSPSQVFVAGDVLYVVEPQATVTIGGTVAVNDTATITIDNKSITVTATTTTLADLIASTVTAINSNYTTKDIVNAISSGGVIYLYAKDGISPYSIAVTKSGTNLTIATGGSATKFAYASVGTISAVAPSTGTITLTGNSSSVVPVGANVGVRVDTVYGLDNHDREFNFETSQHLAVYGISDGVVENFLPYIDGDLKRRFPRMNFSTKF